VGRRSAERRNWGRNEALSQGCGRTSAAKRSHLPLMSHCSKESVIVSSAISRGRGILFLSHSDRTDTVSRYSAQSLDGRPGTGISANSVALEFPEPALMTAAVAWDMVEGGTASRLRFGREVGRVVRPSQAIRQSNLTPSSHALCSRHICHEIDRLNSFNATISSSHSLIATFGPRLPCDLLRCVVTAALSSQGPFTPQLSYPLQLFRA
jgi:hypothetical protein